LELNSRVIWKVSRVPAIEGEESALRKKLKKENVTWADYRDYRTSKTVQ